MTFERFQLGLDKAASRYGVAREFRAIKVCKAFESIIPDIFPDNEHMAKVLTENSYKDAVLTVRVPTSTWASEVMIHKEQILDALNEKLKTNPTKIIVKDLKTKII